GPRRPVGLRSLVFERQFAGRRRAGRKMLFRELWNVQQCFDHPNLRQELLPRGRRSDLHRLDAHLRTSGCRLRHAADRRRADEHQRAAQCERLLSMTVIQEVSGRRAPSGATTIEYALIASLIAVVIIGAVLFSPKSATT